MLCKRHRLARWRRKVVVCVLAALTVCMFMRAAEMRILVQQRVIQPGEKLLLEGWGDLGKSESASLVCRYFTGLGIATSVFWYSPSNVLGRDSCTVVSRERYSLRR